MRLWLCYYLHEFTLILLPQCEIKLYTGSCYSLLHRINTRFNVRNLMSSVTQITVHCMPAILVYVNTHLIATLVGISCLILVNILEHNEVFVMSFLRSSIVVNVDYAVDKMLFFYT